MLDGRVGPIAQATVEQAIGWGVYLESHARRLYGGVTDAPAVAARLLAARIQAGEVSDLFAARDVYRMGWSGLDKDRTESAIDVLLSLHWIEERTEPTRTNTRTRYAIHPKIRFTSRNELTKLTNSEFVSDVSAPPEVNGKKVPLPDSQTAPPPPPEQSGYAPAPLDLDDDRKVVRI